jgi:hypothetical protein
MFLTPVVRTTSLAVLAGVGLAACHAKSSKSTGDTSSRPSMAAVRRHEIAARIGNIKSFGDTASLVGFLSSKTPPSCGSVADIADVCSFTYRDAWSGNREAGLRFLIFDAPVDFRDIDAQVAAVTGDEGGPLNELADASIHTKRQGAEITFPGRCHQALGPHNGDARCEILVDPRVVMLTAVTPRMKTWSLGDPTNTDIARAEWLAAVGSGELGSVKFTSGPIATPSTQAAPSGDRRFANLYSAASLELKRQIIYATGRPAGAIEP